MEPGQMQPNFNRQPVNPNAGFNSMPQSGNVEIPTTPNRLQNPVEQAPMRGAEQLSNAEALAQPTQAMPVMQAIQPQAQQSVVSAPQSHTQAVVSATDPSVAQDTDKIEKEWVDQTKKVLNATHDDPYEQARQISAMMRDYVKKRYGKVVGKAPQE